MTAGGDEPDERLPPVNILFNPESQNARASLAGESPGRKDRACAIFFRYDDNGVFRSGQPEGTLNSLLRERIVIPPRDRTDDIRPEVGQRPLKRFWTCDSGQRDDSPPPERIKRNGFPREPREPDRLVPRGENRHAGNTPPDF